MYRLPDIPEPFDFPDDFTTTKEGLLAVGGNLHPATLIHAYAKGIFPWFGKGDPILWWSPEPRAVILPGKIHVSASMRKFMRRVALITNLVAGAGHSAALPGLHRDDAAAKAGYRLTVNRAFFDVMRECADKRAKGRDDTWIVPEMLKSYTELHRLRYAQSVEVWNSAEKLVGGVYGVSIGRAFFGESMFSHEPNTSKAAIIALCGLLQRSGYLLLDCQVASGHLELLGARCISRREFMAWLRQAGTSNLKSGEWLG